MKKILISIVVAAVVAVPAIVGLWGNASFSQAVPVRVPASGQVVAPSPSPSSTAGTTDDRGGETPRDGRTEPGDDRDVQGVSPSPSASTPGTDDNGGAVRNGSTDDNGGTSGNGRSDDNGGTGNGGTDDHGGHGSDD